MCEANALTSRIEYHWLFNQCMYAGEVTPEEASEEFCTLSKEIERLAPKVMGQLDRSGRKLDNSQVVIQVLDRSLK